MIIRASDLIKSSASFIKYKQDREMKPYVSEGMKRGESFQLANTPSGGNIFVEMQGKYKIDNDLEIRFSNDYINIEKPEYICEIKSVFNEPENWYKASCIIGTAFYKTLIIASAKKNMCELTTAPFELERNGNIEHIIKVKKNIDYYLQFGNAFYLIELKDHKPILSFYTDKAQASLDWDSAKEWDRTYHRKLEWKMLHEFIVVTPKSPIIMSL